MYGVERYGRVRLAARADKPARRHGADNEVTAPDTTPLRRRDEFELRCPGGVGRNSISSRIRLVD
jgi:hypothetical protein